MVKALTLNKTRHGNPGRAYELPAGIWVDVVPASNLPADSDTKWWARPFDPESGEWTPELIAWAEGPGVGLYAEDIVLAEDIVEFKDLDSDVQDALAPEFQNWNVDDGDWHECDIQFWKESLEWLGFSDPDISFSGFWSQGDGASFTASSFDFEQFSTNVLLADARKKEWGLPSTLDLNDLAKPLRFAAVIGEYLEARVVRRFSAGNYYHENTVTVEWTDRRPGDLEGDDPRTWVFVPQHKAIGRIVENFMEEVNTMVRCLCRAIYASLEAEYEYQTSADAVSASLASNGIMFTEDGTRIDVPM